LNDEEERIMTTSELSRRFFLAALGGGALTGAAGCIPDMPVTRLPGASAQLGFGLWAGVPGAKFGDRVDRTVGVRRIVGPRTWTHPVTGQRMTVYVRTKQESSGTKTSYYTLRPDGTALARVLDKRPGAADRYFTGDAFVPVGPWRSGMAKSYAMAQHSSGKATQFTVTIRVTKATFTHKGRSGSMEYIWTERNQSGRKTKELRYVYSPGIGMADVKNLMK
jgi:hypothetical protein